MLYDFTIEIVINQIKYNFFDNYFLFYIVKGLPKTLTSSITISFEILER
jgi:hypothetical protein